MVEAHRNLCNPRWWRSFSGKDHAERGVRAILQTPGVDVNYECDSRGNRPLHIALQDSLTPLREGSTYAIVTFIDEANTLDKSIRNQAGQSCMDLAEIRYDHQIRGLYFKGLLTRRCHNEITSKAYNNQYNQIYTYEIPLYAFIRALYFGGNFDTNASQIAMELWGTTNFDGPNSSKQLCSKIR